MKFKHYSNEDYEAVCGFLIELNRENQNHINWNWGRFEWMAEHPEFDKSATDSIGLWLDNERIVGAAIYDMYFGEAFVGVLPEYSAFYPEILDYAYRELKDENGLGSWLKTQKSFGPVFLQKNTRGYETSRSWCII